MINRILIRIKVLQVIYAFYQKGDSDLKVAENELMMSLRRTYDLYFYFLLLIVDITRAYERMIDARRHKYRPTEAELHPDLRLLNNRLAKQISTNQAFLKYTREHGISWSNDAEFIKKTLERILESDVYNDYITGKDDNYETDKTFWRAVFKRIISDNDAIDDYLEEKCIYWNEDIDVVESFVIKTIKRFNEDSDDWQDLIPMFNNQDDYDYVIKLFRQTLLHGEEFRQRIDNHAKNWESERLALMDIVIMQVAMAELLNFPTIPVSVTLNEYIDAAKYYSTPKSSVFINGVLDAIVAELRDEKLIFKD
ncbi:MAG: transcription antitermination factor NusB [Tannerella sp.]|jgi:N utilization substance protein B|nr:transcription antitermination factor NusB [Tannerella sp.]